MSSVSVIISTYNQPRWLTKALWGFEGQTFTNFDIVIADDGSTEETATVIQQFQQKNVLKIAHIWQEDDGFQKTKILNKAIKATEAEYLIFTDGDCIPRFDLVEKHLAMRKPNSFLSGGYFKLPEDISENISEEDIRTRKCFDAHWLVAQGLKKSFKLNKLTATGTKEQFLNWITPTKATWDGNNASGWREDIVAVNGFDERMQYGGEDRELGERLMNKGVRPIQARYSLVTMHLEHPQGYVTEEMLANNKQIRKTTKTTKSTWTPYGLQQTDA
ncbi:glycosyltransferase family 2 protein [Marinirhabdus gelatinilytica]|uniref:Glycosyltransferase involved in cell wall biosynthesis n=1 Tax=Marinirhabdus gelatinilytica TaxID=1703343 RepID=A0A370QAV2_9FLAO|nr:glycosyltransferase family 2 protein [Marinirhabdus gelatinilytica]RDK85482.1 glycosyltransferase involved in cell wall biosynthesis [Marinirhabdus gelatinilytica]